MSMHPFRLAARSSLLLVGVVLIAGACGGSPGAASNPAAPGTTGPAAPAPGGGSGPATIAGLDPARVGTGVTPQGWSE
jgi:hypothetical protein